MGKSAKHTAARCDVATHSQDVYLLESLCTRGTCTYSTYYVLAGGTRSAVSLAACAGGAPDAARVVRQSKYSHGKCSARCLSGAESGLWKVGRLAERGLLAASGLLPSYYRLLVIYYY